MFLKIKKIQEKIENAQRKLELREFTSQVGDILIVMQGTKQIVDVRIKNIDSLKNLDLIQESLLLSFNDVLQQVEQASQELFIEASKEYEF
ncbi:YbaB/EbfC family nucleoid-associated protein [Candidatus Phytoplasma sacchari]|uniref:YbaB/EbfC family nucleoid-associated protein n=1 Tax=Candidatus Phytoplasma sacchari TaxID=2609813 RepID=A0ABY7M3B2_9MOLU|nr:YbaB/EbfC family nucleoid-associated protein [Candidatus Phytoplasma sacchari]KAB8122670.1 YbaB/EbfC family DNA-binding protein [Candidatus Phytoplasma sacchari]WBL31627.1 YbaB/EbfC family nucleoid-associated protein [Candidatus Phytoplasma sacchari]